MNKTVIIMRHAKAKRPADGQPDMERELTEAGVRSMRATLPDSLGLWPGGAKQVEVWSSPAARAHQTADLLARALRHRGVKAGEVQTLDCLWTGDAAALVQALRESEAPAVAIVGHNPFAEEWTAGLTGSRIVFATGAMACVSVDIDALGPAPRAVAAPGSADDGQCAHRLLWFAQGPVSQRWKTLVSMEGTIADAVDTVHARLEAFYANPEDVETMHKFRVSVRTLRSLVAFVKPWQDARQNERANADLRDIVGVTSRLRELDVLAEQAGDSKGGAEELVGFCEERAAAERGKVMGELSSKAIRRKLERASGELRSINWRKRYRDEGLEASAVRQRFDEMADALRDDLRSLDFAQVERTHDVRKRAKRVRYSAEKFKDIIGEDAVGIAKDMTAYQDNLGAICDARVNIDIINGFALNELPETIAWDLALLRAQNETFLYTALRDSR